MKNKKILIVTGILMLLIVILNTSCSSEYLFLPSGKTEQSTNTINKLENLDKNAVNIIISKNSISCTSSEVVIKNLYPGATVEMNYNFINDTEKTIFPLIYPIMSANVSDYSKGLGYSVAPPEVSKWIKIDELTPLAPGQSKNFLITIIMPYSADTNKYKSIGFQIGASAETGNKIAPAVGVWWLITTR